MKTFLEFLKNRWGHMIGLLLSIMGVIAYGAINDAKAGDLVPLIVIGVLYAIYCVLFYFDYQKFKKIQ